MSRALVFAEWLYEILKLHFLWMIYIIRGIIVAGIFPATAAMYAVVRHWQLKREPKPISELFKQFYHENFKIANQLGWLFLLASFALISNFLYIPTYPEKFRVVMYAIILSLAVFLLILWIYVFPVIVHYKLSVANLFTVMLKAGFVSLSGIIMQVLFVGIFLTIVYNLPALFVLFGITPLALVQVAVSINVFNKIK